MRRIAVIGDVHGCIAEFEELLKQLEHESLDGIWHAGDLVDRGPDSGAVVQKCREAGICGVMGNHESTILKRFDSCQKGNALEPHEDKDRTLASLSSLDIEYLRALPLLHVFDDIETVIAHAGLEPGRPLWKQTQSVCHVQLIHPDFPGTSRWWGYDPKNGCTEEENRKQGWVRWYEVADEPNLVVYGHSVFRKPFLHNRTLGIDTGGVFGGELTAVILPDLKFISVPAKRKYAARGSTSLT